MSEPRLGLRNRPHHRPAGRPLDRDAVNAFAFQVWSYKQGEMVSLMIHLGDRLGLYRAMDGAGPLTPAELAQRAGGLAERWVQEWLRGQAAAKLVDYRGDDRFELTPDRRRRPRRRERQPRLRGRRVRRRLRARDGRSAGRRVPHRHRPHLRHAGRERRAPHRAHARTVGAPRAGAAPSCPRSTVWCRSSSAGARVLDVGCGAGVAIFAMAKAYPEERLRRLRPVAPRRRARPRDRGAAPAFSNVEFFERRGEEVPPDPVYDFVLTFDCLHDMTRPDRVTRAIRARDEGRRHLADQGHQVPRRVREEHAQPDAGA